MLTSLDEKIIKLLKESKTPLSTYEIAKKTKTCWVTAKLHCNDLKLMKLIKSKEDKSEHGKKTHGSQGKLMWWVE